MRSLTATAGCGCCCCCCSACSHKRDSRLPADDRESSSAHDHLFAGRKQPAAQEKWEAEAVALKEWREGASERCVQERGKEKERLASEAAAAGAGMRSPLAVASPPAASDRSSLLTSPPSSAADVRSCIVSFHPLKKRRRRRRRGRKRRRQQQEEEEKRDQEEDSVCRQQGLSPLSRTYLSFPRFLASSSFLQSSFQSLSLSLAILGS